jgi:hypothetical protein
VTLAGTLHCLPQPSGAEKDAADRAQQPPLCRRAAVQSTLRQICARSLACFDRGRALAPACKGDKALVSNAGFRRCLKTVGGERFALIPTRSSRSGSSTASLCRTQHRPQPLGSCSVAKRLWMGEQTFRTAKHPSSTRPIFHNNQPVVGVDRDLNVVADVDLRMRGHTQAAPASPCKVAALLAQGRDYFEVLGSRATAVMPAAFLRSSRSR